MESFFFKAAKIQNISACPVADKIEFCFERGIDRSSSYLLLTMGRLGQYPALTILSPFHMLTWTESSTDSNPVTNKTHLVGDQTLMEMHFRNLNVPFHIIGWTSASETSLWLSLSDTGCPIFKLILPSIGFIQVTFRWILSILEAYRLDPNNYGGWVPEPPQIQVQN